MERKSETLGMTKRDIMKCIRDEMDYWDTVETEAMSMLEELMDLKMRISHTETVTKELFDEFCHLVPARN